MNNNTGGRREQKKKPYSDRAKHSKKDMLKKKIKPRVKKEIISEDELYSRSFLELKKSNIFLLELKTVVLNKEDNHIYAVIHKVDGDNKSVSHKDCVFTTKVIQECIDSLSFQSDDYSITVSSAGFSWTFKSNLEYEVFLGENIKIKFVDGERNNTLIAVLVENDNDFITIENNEDGKKKINKKDIIKIRLNN